MKDQSEIIHDFVSTHEAQDSHYMRIKDSDIKVTFTSFGNKAARKAIVDILNVISENEKLKVLEMMKNKRVTS